MDHCNITKLMAGFGGCLMPMPLKSTGHAYAIKAIRMVIVKTQIIERVNYNLITTFILIHEYTFTTSI